MRKKFAFFLLVSALIFEVKAGFLFDEFGMKTDCHKSYSHAFCVISASDGQKTSLRCLAGPQMGLKWGCAHRF